MSLTPVLDLFGGHQDLDQPLLERTAVKIPLEGASDSQRYDPGLFRDDNDRRVADLREAYRRAVDDYKRRRDEEESAYRRQKDSAAAKGSTTRIIIRDKSKSKDSRSGSKKSSSGSSKDSGGRRSGDLSKRTTK